VARQGFCVWLTGLSGSGKTTIAAALELQLRRLGRDVTVFDGDAVRSQMSSDLGFSRQDRDTNVSRVAARAADVVNASGVAICALMSPYAAARQKARDVIGPERFVLVHVATPLHICESRDVKGLYAKARRGELRNVVGIDAAYEPPEDADLRLDTSASTVQAEVHDILAVLGSRLLQWPP
jgi:sulfate adenylyltransferase